MADLPTLRAKVEAAQAKVHELGDDFWHTYLLALATDLLAALDVSERRHRHRDDVEKDMARQRDEAVQEVTMFRREVTRRRADRKDRPGFGPDAFADLPPAEQIAKLRELLTKTAAELDDCYEAHSQMASQATRAWIDRATAQTERDEARAELTAIRAALGNGADEAAWPPGLTLAEAVGRLREERDEAMDIIQRLTIDPRPLTPAEMAHALTINPASELAGSRCSAVVREVPKLSGFTVRTLCILPAGHEGPHAEALGDNGGSNG